MIRPHARRSRRPIVSSLACLAGATMLLFTGCAPTHQLNRNQIEPSNELVLGAAYLELPRGLDNGRIVPLMDEVLDTAHLCGERMSALSRSSAKKQQAPMGLGMAALVSGLMFAAAAGFSPLIPEGPTRDGYATAMSVTGGAVTATLSGIALAKLASSGGAEGQRLGEVRTSLEYFYERWAMVLENSDYACTAGLESALKQSQGLPASVRGAIASPIPMLVPGVDLGARCLDLPRRSGDPDLGLQWTSLSAWEVFGKELNASRCLLGSGDQDRLERDLRASVSALRGRCTAGVEKLPVRQPSRGTDDALSFPTDGDASSNEACSD